MKLNPNAAEYKPYPNGVQYDGTDPGALIQDYFILEAPALRFRTTPPHAHITIGMSGQVNVSYTSRLNAKIGSVSSDMDWNTIKADSAPIYNGLRAFFQPK